MPLKDHIHVGHRNDDGVEPSDSAGHSPVGRFRWIIPSSGHGGSKAHAEPIEAAGEHLAQTALLEVDLPPAADFYVHLRHGELMRTVVLTIEKGSVNLVYVMVS